MSDLRAGDPVWKFDGNRRVYAEGSHGPPIYREHFVKMEVKAIDARWITVGHVGFDRSNVRLPRKGDGPLRVGKLGNYSTVYYLDEGAVEDDIYRHDNGHRLAEIVRAADAATLRKIAALLDEVTP